MKKIVKILVGTLRLRDVMSGVEYTVCAESDDRFFENIIPYLKSAGVQGRTTLGIDSLTIPIELYNIINDGKFDMEFSYMEGITEKNIELYESVFQVTIPNIKICNVKQSNVDNRNVEGIKLLMYEIVIPYKTKFVIKEIEE